MIIQPLSNKDWPATWRVIEPVIREGKTYVYPPELTESDAHRIWVEDPLITYVSFEGENILGTYYLKPNQPGLGNHICNCGYIVSRSARGQGVASAMCEHSQVEAKARGFRGMQFNLVVSTNRGAIPLWKRHGFDIVGTLPGAFRDPDTGYVDAFVMFKTLH